MKVLGKGNRDYGVLGRGGGGRGAPIFKIRKFTPRDLLTEHIHQISARSYYL